MINAYPKNTDPVKQFLSSIGVANVDASGQATGTTGGNTFMWQDQQAQYQKLLAAQQPQQQSNAFLDSAQPQPAAPAPMAGNSFLSPVGDVRVNGLTPATLAPGGTPMVGRDYGSVNAASGGSSASSGLPSTPLSTFGQRLLATGGTESRNGATFSGAGGGLSITQDPSTVPVRGATGGQSNNDPLVQARFTQLMSTLAGAPAIQGDPMQVISTAAQGLKTDVPNWANLSEQERTIIMADDQRIREAVVAKAKGLAAQGMLPSANQSPEARANRMQYAGGNSFLDASGARDAISGKPKVVEVNGQKFIQYGSGQLMRADDKPQNTLPDGTQRTLEPKAGLTIEAEIIGNRWVDRKTGAPVYITDPITGQNTINPLLSGDQNDPLNNPDGKPSPADKPKLTPAEAKAELERRRASKKQQGK